MQQKKEVTIRNQKTKLVSPQEMLQSPVLTNELGFLIMNKKLKKRDYDKKYYLLNKKKRWKKVIEWRKKNPDKRAEQGRRYRIKYKDKLKEKYKLWKQKNPQLKEKYDFLARRATSGVDISFKDYKILIEKQKGLCAICGKKETYKYGSGKIKQLALDHCHKTKKPRGLLCQKCNTAIGMFGDDISLIKRSIIYLKKYSYDKTR